MKTNNTTGRNFALCIGLYLIVKSVVNMILGGGIGDIIYSVIEAAALLTGLMYINYVVAAAMALVVLLHLKNNLMHPIDNLIYLIEAFIDVVFAVFLVTNKSIKEHFTNKWTEIGKK